MVSMSASVGTTSSTRPRSAATAAKSAWAGAVKPDTRGAGIPSRRRLAADFSSDRKVSELDVYDGTVSEVLKAGTCYFSAFFIRSTIDVVESPSATGRMATRPPRASTVSRPTI